MEKFPKSQKVLSIGWVGTGPFSFYGHYIRVINNTSRDYNFLNMRVTHVWGDDYSKNYKGTREYVTKMLDRWNGPRQSPSGLAEMYSIPNVCKDYHEMVDDVDAAMIMDFDRAYELAEPFLRQGKPVFLCSPVAVSVPECERILDLAEANNAAVYSGSFTVDIQQNQIHYLRAKQEEIATFYASTGLGFYTSYANDGLEPVYRLIGGGVKRVSLHGWNGSSGYDPSDVPLSHIYLEYEPRGDYLPIRGYLTLGARAWYRVYYQDHTMLEYQRISGSQEFTFRDFLINIQEVFTTNKSLETRDDILQKMRVVIGAYQSANEGGRMVDVAEVGDYRLPTIRTEHWYEIPE